MENDIQRILLEMKQNGCCGNADAIGISAMPGFVVPDSFQ